MLPALRNRHTTDGGGGRRAPRRPRGTPADEGQYGLPVAFEGEAGDEFGFQPPPPEERSWRHPSELGGGGGLARPVNLVTSAPTPPPSGPGRTVLIAVLSATLGSALTLAAVVGLGGFRKDPPDPAGVVRQEVDSGRTSLSPVEIAEKVVPSVARIDADGAKGAVAGTAVVIRSNAVAAYLVTTADLVDGADSITVTVGDGPSHPAQF